MHLNKTVRDQTISMRERLNFYKALEKETTERSVSIVRVPALLKDLNESGAWDLMTRVSGQVHCVIGAHNAYIEYLMGRQQDSSINHPDHAEDSMRHEKKIENNIDVLVTLNNALVNALLLKKSVIEIKV